MADAAADIEEHSGGAAMQTAKDLFSGAVGGVAQVLLGMLPPPPSPSAIPPNSPVLSSTAPY